MSPRSLIGLLSRPGSPGLIVSRTSLYIASVGWMLALIIRRAIRLTIKKLDRGWLITEANPNLFGTCRTPWKPNPDIWELNDIGRWSLQSHLGALLKSFEDYQSAKKILMILGDDLSRRSDVFVILSLYTPLKFHGMSKFGSECYPLKDWSICFLKYFMFFMYVGKQLCWVMYLFAVLFLCRSL